MNSSLLATTNVTHFIEFQDLQPLHCSKDALTDFFGWLLQGLLAAIAFSCLIGEILTGTVIIVVPNAIMMVFVLKFLSTNYQIIYS